MFKYDEYLRMDKFPHIWCPGCGNGIVLKAMVRAIDSCGLDKDNTVIVSGIGCSSRAPGYMDFNTLHTTHGRALAFATGVKVAKPSLNVIVVSGDGDGTAIGGNHFIHACRRNIDITLILFNNYNYGMTGGQYSPTTPMGSYATTAPYGQPDNPFDISVLAAAAGAAFVARGSTFQAAQLDKLMARGIKKKGFSLVEVITDCTEIYGRRNRLGGPTEMLLRQKEVTVSKAKAESMSPEELEDKLITGVLVEVDKPEYCESYEKIIKKAQAKATAKAS